MIGNVASVTTSDTDYSLQMTHSSVAPSKFGYSPLTHSLVYRTNSECFATGSEAARQGVQKSRQREEMQRTIRNSG